jgi:hypothetical protein
MKRIKNKESKKRKLKKVGIFKFPSNMTLERFQDNLYFQLNNHGFSKFYLSDLKLIDKGRIELTIHSHEESEWLKLFSNNMINAAIGCDID